MKVPTGVTFQNKIMRESIRGDNWCTTWGADGNLYTSMCDGYGWDSTRTKEIHSEVLKISGGFDNVFGEAVSGYPVDFNVVDKTDRYMPYFFGYGIVSVKGTIYQFLSRQNATNFMPPFQGVNIISTPDNGKTWYRYDGANVSNTTLDHSPDTQFIWHEQGTEIDGKTGYAFACISVCQMGQDNTKGEQDGYVYLYSPDGSKAHELNMARVPETSINDKSAYEYFTSRNEDGSANWTSSMAARGIVHTYPKSNTNGDNFGWYSWLPSVVWNEGLGLYIMANGGTYSFENYWDKGTNLHKKSGSLGLYYSEKPWGPWTQFYNDDHWQPGGDINERTYQPKLLPKWISEDGKEMVLIWSDAGYHWGNAKGKPKYYKWNQMKISLELKTSNSFLNN